MNEKTKKILKIIYVVLCIGGGIGALSTGLRGILAAPFLIAAGLVAIPKVSSAVPFFKSNKAATIACSAVLFIVGGLILPKQQTPERVEQEPQSRSIPIVTEADTTESTTIAATTPTETTKETTTTAKETTTTTKATTTTVVKTAAASQTTAFTAKEVKTTAKYILNPNGKPPKIHLPSCPSVKNMDEENRVEFNGTIEEAEKKGYKRCGNCLD